MKSMNLTTKKGYQFFEVASAFQKAVRRNDEPVAMYFAVELVNSGYDEYLWKRIKIIVSEDIGLAEPNIVSNIAGLYSNFTDLKKDKKDGMPQRIFISHAVLMICRAKKSRICDYALINYWRTHEEHKLEIPDYAYDQHNLKGKRMGRGLEHFFSEGSHVENHAEQSGEAEYKRLAFEVRQRSEKNLVIDAPKVADQNPTENKTLFD